MDQKKLRFVRGNLKLFLLTASRKRHASIIALSEAFTIRVPGIPTMNLARMYNIGVS